MAIPQVPIAVVIQESCKSFSRRDKSKEGEECEVLQVVTEGEQASKDSGQTLESVGRSVGRH